MRYTRIFCPAFATIGSLLLFIINVTTAEYIGTDSVHRYASGVKCWTDYHREKTYNYWDAWKKASGNVYCTGTSLCSVARMDGVQVCEQWSAELSVTIKSAVVDASVRLGYSHQTCNVGQDTTQCTWNDQQCHCIWTQQQMVANDIKVLRRCNFKDGKGDVTTEEKWIYNRAPTKVVNYGCGSKCTD